MRMGLFDFFKNRNKDPEVDPLSDLTLAKLKKGYFVDYDLKSWQVISSNRYDWGAGDITYEWQISSSDDTLFLEREPDDEDYWSVSRKLPFVKLDASIRKQITDTDHAPETIVFEGKTFYLDETGGALFYRNGDTDGKEVFKWDYTDDAGLDSLTVEQWGETEYELCLGHKVDEYQFSNILPVA